jgi:hypothetical protein
MTTKDYDLLIHICLHSLRKGNDLTISQVEDIQRMINKLHSEKQIKVKYNANIRNKKVGQRKRLYSN